MTVELDEVRAKEFRTGFKTISGEVASIWLTGSFTKVRVSFGGLRLGCDSSRERFWTDCWRPWACEGLPIHQAMSETFPCNKRCSVPNYIMRSTYENSVMR